jgi:hypothetical protein
MLIEACGLVTNFPIKELGEAVNLTASYVCRPAVSVALLELTFHCLHCGRHVTSVLCVGGNPCLWIDLPSLVSTKVFATSLKGHNMYMHDRQLRGLCYAVLVTRAGQAMFDEERPLTFVPQWATLPSYE